MHAEDFSDRPGTRIQHSELVAKLQAACAAKLGGGSASNTSPQLECDAVTALAERARDADFAAFAPPCLLGCAVCVPAGEDGLSVLCRAFDIRSSHALIADPVAHPALIEKTWDDAQVAAIDDPAVAAWVSQVGRAQATRAGVEMLKAPFPLGLKDSELSIFFWQSHFWVLLKLATPGEPPRLLLLETAEALAEVEGGAIVWRELTDDLAESAFVRGDFSATLAATPSVEDDEAFARALHASLNETGGAGGGAAAAPQPQPTFATLPPAAVAQPVNRNDLQAQKNAQMKRLHDERVARERASAAARGAGGGKAAAPPPTQVPRKEDKGCAVC